METTKRAIHYLANLEWTERVQLVCKFCDQANFESIVYRVRHRHFLTDRDAG